MTEYTAVCEVNDGDTVRALIDDGGVHLVARKNGRFATDLILSLEKTREFARALIALADEIDGGEAADTRLKVGDRVVIVREWKTGTGTDDGTAGTLVQLDAEDEHFPYCVCPDSDPGRTVWAHEVQRECVAESAEAPAPSVAPTRAALLEEARRLVGPSAAPRDVVEYARFLAGE
ncbi:hypothetical protein [Streptomyces sparsogenes]|uniref:hypothetical protein n=1 Tax=Streptomyces sparsogenes TaxID=67365 RepID=UPI0033F05104